MVTKARSAGVIITNVALLLLPWHHTTTRGQDLTVFTRLLASKQHQYGAGVATAVGEGGNKSVHFAFMTPTRAMPS